MLTLPAILALAISGPMPQSAADLTTDQDYAETLAMLKISGIRMWADGMNPNSPNAPNVDEAKADKYGNYPDALKFRDGAAVRTRSDWDRRRREITEDFDREIYGRVPRNVPGVTWRTVWSAEVEENGIPVSRRTVIGTVDNRAFPSISVEIPLVVVTPRNASRRVPLVMEFAFGRAPTVSQPNPPPFGPPPTAGQTPWTAQTLRQGWGYALIYPYAYQADNGAGLRKGIIGLTNHGRLRQPDEWGALRAWAWGASRALDFLTQDRAVDGRKVAIEGLSRFGKASLVTMAYDTRFAAALVGSSGAGGAKPWRRDFGERESNLASSGSYHWMTPNFIKYAGPLTPSDMPVEQDELIALCAPRPAFVGVGSPNVEGTWVDATGTYLSTLRASRVYRLLGKSGLSTDVRPPEDRGLLSGELAFRQHSGGHTNAPNWPYFLDWAARYFDRP